MTRTRKIVVAASSISALAIGAGVTIPALAHDPPPSPERPVPHERMMDEGWPGHDQMHNSWRDMNRVMDRVHDSDECPYAQ